MIKFIKSLGIYFFGNIFSKIIIFFMLPIYTAKIAPVNFGYYDVTLTYLEIITGVIFVNLQLGVLRFMYDKKDEIEKYETVYNALPIYLFSLIVYIVTMIVADYFFDIKYLFWVMLYGVFFSLEKCMGYIARGLGKNALFASSGIISTIVIVVVNLVGLLGFKLDYWILYLAFVLGSLTQVLIISYKLRIFQYFSIKKMNFLEGKEILKFCIPMAVNSVVYWFLSGVNKIIIADQLGNTANGYYAIAIKFGVIVSLIGTVFGWVWQEVSFEIETTKTKEEKNKFYSYVLIKYLQFLILGVSGVILIVKIIFPLLIHESYHRAFNLIPLYMIVSMLNTYSTFYTNIYAAIKKTKIVFFATVVSSVVNLLLITVMINPIGIQASNISLFVSYIIDIILKHYILSKEMTLDCNFKKIWLLIPLVLLVFIGYFTFDFMGTIILLIIIAFISMRVFRNEIRMFSTEIQSAVKRI